MRTWLWLSATLLTACSHRWHGPEEWRTVPRVRVATEGVTLIDGQDEFVLSAGGDVQTPFWTYDCPGLPTTSNYGLGLRLGARRVAVDHPAANKRLHGVLAFCHVGPWTRAPTQRLYLVTIPDSYIAATAGGRVSVVYEPSGHVMDYADGSHDTPAWILWLSETPL